MVKKPTSPFGNCREGDGKSRRGRNGEADRDPVVIHTDIVQRSPVESKDLAGDHIGGVEQNQRLTRLVEDTHRRLGLQQVFDHLLQQFDTGLVFELQRDPGGGV